MGWNLVMVNFIHVSAKISLPMSCTPERKRRATLMPGLVAPGVALCMLMTYFGEISALL